MFIIMFYFEEFIKRLFRFSMLMKTKIYNIQFGILIKTKVIVKYVKRLVNKLLLCFEFKKKKNRNCDRMF